MATKSMDRRAARTRALLHEALLSLMRTKSYDAITVEELCERANVGRSTFYSHFSDKDDLKRNGLEKLREELLERQAGASRDRNSRLLGFSLTMFEHARGHAHLYHALVGGRGGAIALATIRRILSDLVRRELAAGGSMMSADEAPHEFVVQYIVGAYMAVLTWWLDGGAKLPPERVDAMFRRLATKGIAKKGSPP